MVDFITYPEISYLYDEFMMVWKIVAHIFDRALIGGRRWARTVAPLLLSGPRFSFYSTDM